MRISRHFALFARTMKFRGSRIALVAMFLVPASIVMSIFLAPVWAQRTTQRLILKDGSYQVVTKYEIRGDRVHYFSAERSEWEDVPVALIDWDATKKWQEELANRRRPPASSSGSDASESEIKQVDAEERAERGKEAAMSPEVVAGVKLPESGGVFLLDVYQNK